MALEPVDTYLSSSIKFPSTLFTLFKHELFPYERFAYNVLHIGIEALNTVNLPESITVDYTKRSLILAPWTINASINNNRSDSGDLLGFEVNLPEFLPVMTYLFIHIMKDFFHHDNLIEYAKDTKLLTKKVQKYFDILNEGAKSYKENNNSIGLAVRTIYKTSDITIFKLNESVNQFDLLSQLIANHEIAHAYLGQLSDWKGGPKLDWSAYELLADLTASEWFFNKMIKNTPKTEAYLKDTGYDDYSQAICRNFDLVLEAQLSLLILMGLAGAMQSGGKVTLEGGGIHPNSLLRYFLQHIHIYTLIRSNYDEHIDEESLKFIESKHSLGMNVLTNTGFISTTDIETLMDKNSYNIIERAAQIIDEKNIIPLKNVGKFLENYKERLQKSQNK